MGGTDLASAATLRWQSLQSNPQGSLLARESSSKSQTRNRCPESTDRRRARTEREPPQGKAILRGRIQSIIELRPNCGSAENLGHDVPVHVCETEVPPLDAIGQPRVVDSEEVENGRVEVMHMHRVFDHSPAQIV